jgi:hypothetical protein
MGLDCFPYPRLRWDQVPPRAMPESLPSVPCCASCTYGGPPGSAAASREHCTTDDLGLTLQAFAGPLTDSQAGNRASN